MEQLLIIRALFVVAGLCEIGAVISYGGWMSEHKPLLWALVGGPILAGVSRLLYDSHRTPSRLLEVVSLVLLAGSWAFLIVALVVFGVT